MSFKGLRDSCVLVTGGTGSMGRALVEELTRSGVSEIRVLSRHERNGRAERSGGPILRFLAGDIADPEALTRAVQGVDVIFHLAALKDVAACEVDPQAAIQTNVVGSANLLAAVRNEPRVRQLVAASSSKACAPTGVLGITKALMERLVTQIAGEAMRSFVSVRFGNVWPAEGSVLTRWQESADRESRIDVTNPKMTRFVLTTKEAVAHLIALASRPSAGEVIAPPMAAYRLGDLADAFARERGVAIRVVGPRQGEKLHEDLVSEAEAPMARKEGDLIVIGRRHVGAGFEAVSSADIRPISEIKIRELLRSS